MNTACPHCSAPVIDDGSLAGAIVECPGCSGQFQMPPASARVRVAAPAPPRMPIRRRKDPVIAALLSCVWPGAGHFYLGDYRKATILALVWPAASLAAYAILCFAWFIVLGAWGIGVYSAYRDAEQINNG